MDHPQPLLERRRGDDSGSVDAFANAILNEKDPVVRGYMENLRSQIATIAARHGANARDVWNKEVQDRMSVDEMERVNMLFARIKAIAEKKVSSVDARGMEEELSDRMAAAWAMLAEALGGISQKSYGYDEVFQMYVRAGKLMNAISLYERNASKFGSVSSGPEFAVSLELLRAKVAAEHGFPHQVSGILSNAVEKAVSQRRMDANGMRSPFTRNRLFAKAFGAYLASLTDDEVALECGNESPAHHEYSRVAIDRLWMEVRKRGLEYIDSVRDALMSYESDVSHDQGLPESAFVRVAEWLVVAEAAHAEGLDPSNYLERAAARYKASLEIVVDELGNPMGSLPEEFVQTLARVGRTDRIGELMGRQSLADLGESIWFPMFEGLVDAGEYETAFKIYDQTNSHNWKDENPQPLIDRLLDAGKFSVAERAYRLFGFYDPDIEFHIALGKQAARARLGEDILPEARHGLGTALENDDPFGPPRDLVLANAAIATIGYTVEMKKRIEEYASKR